MSIAQRIGHLDGAVGAADASYLLDRGFSADRELGSTGLMHLTASNEEYVLDVIVAKGLMTAIVTYADEEYDGTEPVEVEEASFEFTRGNVSFAYAKMLNFASRYVSVIDLVTA